jgi:hypothetical protein
MNPVLVGSIRQRMREQTTEQLLELWVTNDRAMWSPEAFEAVKSLLAERGVKELPPQNDPAPVATTHQPEDDPVARYWLGWLRPVLWLGCVVSVAGLPRLLTVVWMPRAISLERAWAEAGWLAVCAGMLDLCLPVVLGIGAVGALRLKAWSRPLLLTYAGVAAANGVVLSALHLWRLRLYASLDVWLIAGPDSLNALALNLALPVIVWMLLRRPEIRSLFTPVVSGSAFEPLPVDATLPHPAAR